MERPIANSAKATFGQAQRTNKSQAGYVIVTALLLVGGLLSLLSPARKAAAQAVSPTVLDPNLAVRTVVSGLTMPTSMAFIGQSDFLVLEKSTGRVRRVTSGVLHDTVLDLAVNFASERGLLGIALHPDFPATPLSTYTGRKALPGRTPMIWRRCRCWAIALTASPGTARR